MKYKSGEEFLNKLYNDMHMSDVVSHTALKSDTPTEKIERYLLRLEKAHNTAKTNEHKMKLLKEFYYDKYVIKELPDNYIKLQQKIAREEGNGTIDITEDKREEMLETIIKDQEGSLSHIIDYLTSDDVIYPMWFSNYVFQGILKLGKYDKEKGEFLKRTKSTTEPFLDINSEILAKMYDILSHEIGKDDLTEKEEEILKQGESFSKLYLYYLNKMGIREINEETDGIWKKYEQGGNYQELLESLQEKNTGWCTAGEQTCKRQLANGDFYIYYTKDKNGEYTDPRIAIRMDGKNRIKEVRGVGYKQNLEENMIDIADKKLDEFPDKEMYQKKVHDMRLLTEIDEKTENGIELTKDELKFLYELDNKIDGFGFKKDPRIEEIKSKRNKKKDTADIYGVKENQVATSLEDFESNDIVVYLGKLEIKDEKVPSSFKNLKVITGTAGFSSLKDATGLNSLQIIRGDASFSSLEDATDLSSLQIIRGDAYFESLEDSTGLSSLKSIGANAMFPSLEDAKGLSSLQSIGELACFTFLKDATGLSNLQFVSYFYSNYLKDATPLKNCNRYPEINKQVEKNIMLRYNKNTSKKTGPHK